MKGVGCPTGTVLLSTGTCTCSYKCSAAFKLCSSRYKCTSDLQVMSRMTHIFICFLSKNENFSFKCQSVEATCTPGGPDKICSDGKCYLSTSACPSGTFLVTQNACTCAFNCTATTSSLQVYLIIYLIPH